MAIEAVIWDFGGVFTTSPFEAFRRFEAQRGLPQDFIRRVNAADPDANAWALFERNEIDAAAFDTMFLEEATRLGHRCAAPRCCPCCRATCGLAWWRR
jgi:putative hydrolase of the HAD superfamily